MRILMVCIVVTALANAANDVTTAYSYEGHERAERILGEEYGERCTEFGTFSECVTAFQDGDE
jgi:hypothetical protein